MFEYLSNIMKDLFYGYVEIKCVNPTCNRIFRLSRNNNINENYSCNMGCALNYFNITNNCKEIIYFNDNHNDDHNIV